MKIVILLGFLVSCSAWASEGCDIGARYAGLGFIDAKNNMPDKNRIEEINHRVDDSYKKVAFDFMQIGRDYYQAKPNSSQGEMENHARQLCELAGK